jgi:thiosulfate/3-mercaptopyruvate sulfurtransferase
MQTFGMAFTTIVSTDELAARSDDPDWVVVDVRFSLADPEAGRAAYETGHIPGAVFADLNRDLADPPGGGRGRHPLPPPEAAARTFGGLGIGTGVQVVAYDESDGMYASRLWWMLRHAGHDAAAVLDGGFAKWTREGRPVAAGVERRPSREFVARPRPEMAVGASEVDAARRDPSRAVLDSRSPDRYRGENETIDPVAGHIPGARSRFYKLNVNPDGTMRDAAALRAEFEAALGGVAPEGAVVYCGSGVTACQNLLALEHAGVRGVRLYPGSWSEWISDPSRPIATGDESTPV